MGDVSIISKQTLEICVTVLNFITLLSSVIMYLSLYKTIMAIYDNYVFLVTYDVLSIRWRHHCLTTLGSFEAGENMMIEYLIL